VEGVDSTQLLRGASASGVGEGGGGAPRRRPHKPSKQPSCILATAKPCRAANKATAPLPAPTNPPSSPCSRRHRCLSLLATRTPPPPHQSTKQSQRSPPPQKHAAYSTTIPPATPTLETPTPAPSPVEHIVPVPALLGEEVPQHAPQEGVVRLLVKTQRPARARVCVCVRVCV
jgi:hypothetical protein